MIIPEKNVERWAAEIIGQCTADTPERLGRGSYYRSIYLTGSDQGLPQIYNKTFDAIEDLSSYLCSTADLRFKVHAGMGDLQRAKARAVADHMLDQSRDCGLDTKIEEATTWSLVKGKAFLKLNFGADGLEPHVIQPEFIGVMRPDLQTLDDQEAFVHSTYITPSQFAQLISSHPDRINLARRAMKYATQQSGGDSPDQSAMLKQIVIGGYQPYQSAADPGQSQQPTSQFVQWLAGPYPNFDAKVISQLMRIDELWVRDDLRRDSEGRREWTTIIMVGDVILFGKEQRLNLFADSIDRHNREVNRKPDNENPLAFRHPFIEFSPNMLDGYFWGRSEINNIALLQESINKRLVGINNLLRRQESPPTFYQGNTGMTSDKHTTLNKPGGWMIEENPAAKPPQPLAPQVPPGLYESLQQSERMFDVMTGMTPTLQGEGGPGVRSMSQARVLTQNATPRFKKKAIRIERSVQATAGLLYDILRARSIELLTAWVVKSPALPLEAAKPAVDPFLEPPAPNMEAVQFMIHQMPDKVRVTVDSHSSSPAFGDEAMRKAVMLKQAGIMPPLDMVDIIDPPNRDEIEADVIKAQMMALAQQQAELHDPQIAKQAHKDAVSRAAKKLG